MNFSTLPKTLQGRDSRNYIVEPKSNLKDILRCKSKQVRLVLHKKTKKKIHIESFEAYNRLFDEGVLDEERITEWKTNARQYFTTYETNSPFKKDGQVQFKAEEERFYIIDFDDYVNISELPMFMKEKGFFSLSRSGKIHYYFKCRDDIRNFLGNKVMMFRNCNGEMFCDIDLKEMIYELNSGFIYFNNAEKNMFVSSCELSRLFITPEKKSVKETQKEMSPYQHELAISDWEKLLDICWQENQTWNGWSRMCFLLPEGKEFEDLFYYWSNKNYKAHEDECRHYFQKSKHIGSIGAVINICKFYNENATRDLIGNVKIEGSKKWIESGDKGVAKLFYHLNKNKLVFIEDTWYERTNMGLWKKMNCKISGLINIISDSVSPCIQSMIRDVEEEEQSEEREERLKNLKKLLTKLNTAKFLSDCLKMAGKYFVRDDIQMDRKPYLFGFENGVFDFSENVRKFRKYEAEDYVSMSCGYDYDEKKANDETYKRELNDLISKALPNPEIRQFYLETMARCLIGINSQKFIIANGTGGNAKGVCIENLGSAVFGDYAYNFPVQNLTDTKKTGANTEVASCHLKRFIYAKEPSNKKKLDNATIKELTGGGEINARKIFSLQLKTLLTGTLFMETNPKLNWNEEPDEAELRRVGLIPFTSHFTHNPEEVNEVNHIYLANDELKNKEWFLTRANTFFEILKNTLLATDCNLHVKMPHIIKHSTEEYLQRGINLLEFIKQEYEEAESEVFSLLDFIRDYKMSDYYNFLPRDEKANIKQTIEDLFQTNTFCKKYYRERHTRQLNGSRIDIRKAIVGLKKRTNEDEGVDE